MSTHIGFWALGIALVVGGASAAIGSRGSLSPSPANELEPVAVPSGTSGAFDPADVNMGQGALPQQAALPPGHPPIGSSAAASLPAASSEAATITWHPPAAWAEAPNPSTMRLATYRVPRAPGDDADAELSVSRAGGTAEANVERWIGQFDDAGKDERAERTVHGLKVTVVDVGGTFLGGGMTPSSGVARHPGFRLLGAVVETQGSPYFFKLTGPSATVRAARASFDAMIASVAPVH